MDKGEQIVFMTKDGLTELEALKNYKFDDAPDHLRYIAEIIQKGGITNVGHRKNRKRD